MVPSMKESGEKTNSMVKVQKHGLMEHHILEIMWMVRSMEWESLLGLMEVLTMESSLITILMEKVFTNGQTADNSTETGRTIKWKEVECFHGLITEDTKESTLMTRKKDMVCFIGLMEESTKVNGKMVNNMEKDFTLHKVESRERENGPMERESIG